ncbi:MAG: PD-(D/E)XK nuclease family protein [Clostridia bacterium]|nr:PD-(D/E)XK nuclease family protein [Clostridia bacterium]
MLHRIIGRAASGKTTRILTYLKEKQSAGVDCLFIVPEQQSLDAELMLEEQGLAALGTEVLNFERLPNHVMRHIGGVAVETVDALGKCVLIQRAAALCTDKLCAYKEMGGKALSEVAATIAALKRLGVSPDMLLQTAKKLKGGEDEGLSRKLYEIGHIYGGYDRLLGEGRQDDCDALVRLARTEGAGEFFEGKAVFIDGMYTYTPAQYEMIALMAKHAEDIYISFTADEGELFYETMRCAEEVKRRCHVPNYDDHRAGNYRTADPALRYAEKHLWQKCDAYGEETDSIRLAACADRYEECLRAASEIYALRQRGYRFDSIAVACRHPENYSGIIDTVFAKYGIPFYFAEKDSAATKPLFAFISGLLEMASQRYPLWAVKKYLKSTFSVLTAEEVDVVLHYSESWSIQGKAWVSDKDWLMHPKGYAEDFKPEDERLLEVINGARARFADSVRPVVDGLRAKGLTVGEGVQIIYAHLTDCGVADALTEAAARLSELGDDDGAAKTAALWGVTVDVLDRLYTYAGDMPTTAEKLLELISAMTESINIGAIPSYTDGVSIGNARLMRTQSTRAMLILGVNDGEFPSMPKKSGVFDSKESAVLEKEGIELLPSIDKAVNEERFFFYMCVAAPSEYLSVSYVKAEGGRPSPAYRTLAAMFPKAVKEDFGKDERDYMFCAEAAADRLPYIKNSALKASLAEALDAMGYGADAEEAPPLQDSEAYIGARDRTEIYLSFSRIDCYNNCRFGYYLTYVLKLRDDRSIKFSAANAGTYMHAIMEEYMKNRVMDGAFVSCDKAETEAEVEAITADFVKKHFPEKPSKRLCKLFDRLKNAAVFVCESMCEEFRNSDFVPQSFELGIGRGDGSIAPIRKLTPKGRRVITTGVIDRLDSAVINGKKYVRVVDYKSSEKHVTPEMVERGEGIQMLSYLFTYCDDKATDALPAGVLYRVFSIPTDGKELTQSGMVLGDEDVLCAMDRRTGGKLGGKGGVIKGCAVSAEAMEGFRDKVYGHIVDTAEGILDGEMDVSPFKKESTDCDFCPYGEICRQKKPSKYTY